MKAILSCSTVVLLLLVAVAPAQAWYVDQLCVQLCEGASWEGLVTVTVKQTDGPWSESAIVPIGQCLIGTHADPVIDLPDGIQGQDPPWTGSFKIDLTLDPPSPFEVETVEYGTIYLVPNPYPWADVTGSGLEFTIEGYCEWADGNIQILVTICPLPDGGEGCTPGFWKNHWRAWRPTGYCPCQDFDNVFGVDMFRCYKPLWLALRLHGGGKRALARHAVAALLNAAHPDVDYGLTVGDVIGIVQETDATGEYEKAKNELEGFNEQVCPLGEGRNCRACGILKKVRTLLR